MVDVAALQFVGPSTLVYSLTSNNFLLNSIFYYFLFSAYNNSRAYIIPYIIPTVSVETWRTLLIRDPTLLHLICHKGC